MKQIMEELNNIEDSSVVHLKNMDKEDEQNKFEEMSAGSVTPTLSESGSQTIVPMHPDSLSSCSNQNGHHHHHHHHQLSMQQSHSLDDQTLVPIQKRICLVGTVVDNKEALAAAKSFNVPVVTSETGSEFIEDNNWITYFILNDFEGPLYEAISRMKHKVLGPPALLQAVASKDGLPNNNRPIYNYAMRGTTTCFTGVRRKDELTRLVHLIHSMGGSIRKDMTSKVTHLICNTVGGEKYQYAMTFRLAVVRPNWVFDAWMRRSEPNFLSTNDEFTAPHRLLAFEGQRVCFFGFASEDHLHMVTLLNTYLGISTTIEDPDCTHVVVEEHNVQTLPDKTNSKTHIVKAAWFWFTIQNGYAYENEYQFSDYLESIANTPGSCGDVTERRDSLINYSSKAHRKRKRLSRMGLDGTPVSTGKRRSSVSDAGLLSVSGSFIDCTVSPDKHDSIKLNEVTPVSEAPLKKSSMRHNHFMDFFQTESNYVGILDTIVTLFKIPLERMTEEEPESALLNKSEIKSIFSNFLPIYEVHKKMLNRLQEMHSSWSEDCLIGQIILENRNDLVKAYPPYVNFFEQMKETLVQCDQTNPRFHAFLKINQAMPECGRQSLQDLLIRPVQRLPSISLLLNDIIKHTGPKCPDREQLLDAVKAIKEVMTYINEDKRRTEAQKALFDIFHDIDNCPPDLISSHRSFISRCEVTELSDILSGRGDSLMLFLFTDQLEICKKRSKAFGNSKSPSANPTSAAITATNGKGSVKPYKHIRVINLSAIRLIADISDSPRAFALSYRNAPQQDKSEKLYSFSIVDDEIDKNAYLKKFSKQMAENACKADAEKFVTQIHSEEIGIDISDATVGTLSKAFKFASRTRIKVGRAFSFNKTPSKLKRAVSTMITSPFGSTNSLTPASQLSQLKLQSCTNINECGDGESESASSSPDRPEILIAPNTVQPTRKTTSISISGLRRI